MIGTQNFVAVFNSANTLLAAGFCERWPKAWRDGFALVPRAAFDSVKKLAANEKRLYAEQAKRDELNR